MEAMTTRKITAFLMCPAANGDASGGTPAASAASGGHIKKGAHCLACFLASSGGGIGDFSLCLSSKRTHVFPAEPHLVVVRAVFYEDPSLALTKPVLSGTPVCDHRLDVCGDAFSTVLAKGFDRDVCDGVRPYVTVTSHAVVASAGTSLLPMTGVEPHLHPLIEGHLPCDASGESAIPLLVEPSNRALVVPWIGVHDAALLALAHLLKRSHEGAAPVAKQQDHEPDGEEGVEHGSVLKQEAHVQRANDNCGRSKGEPKEKSAHGLRLHLLLGGALGFAPLELRASLLTRNACEFLEVVGAINRDEPVAAPIVHGLLGDSQCL
jgi:hypothetical protein